MDQRLTSRKFMSMAGATLGAADKAMTYVIPEVAPNAMPEASNIRRLFHCQCVGEEVYQSGLNSLNP